MSQVTEWTCTKGMPIRKAVDGSPTQGSGNSKRFYVGRSRDNESQWFDYDSLAQFQQSYTGMGQIVRATLNIQTDNFVGQFGQPGTNDHPKIVVRRLTQTFTEGNAPDGDWQSNDYDTAKATTSDQVVKTMSKASSGLTQIDITAIVEDWAPKSVKRRNGQPGGNAAVKGYLGFFGTSDKTEAWSGWSEDASAPNRPFIEVEWEYGATTPDAPSALSPDGSATAPITFEGDFTDDDPDDVLTKYEVEVYSGATRVWYSGVIIASETERANAHFTFTPDSLDLTPVTGYLWRARVTDNEGKVSAWSAYASLSIDNTDPDAPSGLTPDGASLDTLTGVVFTHVDPYSDPDGDALSSYQVQVATGTDFDTDQLTWDTGRRFVKSGDEAWAILYGGRSLDVGTYYWRARVWDARGGLSDWSSYATFDITTDFDVEPGNQPLLQYKTRAPWRIVIRNMLDENGDPTAGRGPGTVVAILENAKSVGASEVYNSPGEAHWTLPIDHPQIAAIEPKQTHYAIEFYSGDGWRETFAGLVWDFDATETSVVFTGIDYLGLFDMVLDERFDPARIDKPDEKGGSKWVNRSISYIVGKMLTRAVGLTNSPVGFISVGTIDSMPETVTIWSTMQPTLQFCGALIDSHRAGRTEKKTRLRVRKTTGGTYEVIVEDNPGRTRDDLRLRYGELVNGFRIIAFGQDWASVHHGVGRAREGVKVFYKTAKAAGIDPTVFGRIAQAAVFDGVADENDLIRRNQQAANTKGRLGRNIGMKIRSGLIQPKAGYNITDKVPVEIVKGPINTGAFGSGYYDIMAVAWEAGDDGSQDTTLTLWPTEDGSEPSEDLLSSIPISPQGEWQIGGRDPDEANPTSRYYLDQGSGIVYVLQDGELIVEGGVTSTTT